MNIYCHCLHKLASFFILFTAIYTQAMLAGDHLPLCKLMDIYDTIPLFGSKLEGETVNYNNATFSNFAELSEDVISTVKIFQHVREKSGVSKERFLAALSAYNKAQDQLLNSDLNWSLKQKSNYLDESIFFTCGTKVNPGTQVVHVGDLHSDALYLPSMMRELELRKIIRFSSDEIIINDDSMLIFGGDYSGKGIAGVEVLYFILQLATKNPQRCFIVRGNHEEINKNKSNGFILELASKFYTKIGLGDTIKSQLEKDYALVEKELFPKLHEIYKRMPLDVFLGVENAKEVTYLVYGHGCPLQPTYSPHNLFSTLLNQETNQLIFDPYYNTRDKLEQVFDYNKKSCALLASKKHALTTPGQGNKICFFFNDLLIGENNTSPKPYTTEMNGLQVGKDLAAAILKDWRYIDLANPNKGSKVKIVLRGHQHAIDSTKPMMQQLFLQRGVALVWNDDIEKAISSTYTIPKNSMYTLQIAPQTPNGLNDEQLVEAKMLTPENAQSNKKNGLSYPGFGYNTAALVVTGDQKDNWQLHKINIPKKMLPGDSADNNHTIRVMGKTINTYDIV